MPTRLKMKGYRESKHTSDHSQQRRKREVEPGNGATVEKRNGRLTDAKVVTRQYNPLPEKLMMTQRKTKK